MKRPAHIDGHYRICCGNRQGQCDDCPMKAWEIGVSTGKLDHLLTCQCGVRAKDEKFLGEFGPEGYACIECIRKKGEQAARANRELIEGKT